MTRPFRFGVGVLRSESRVEWVEMARKVEDCGYSTLFMPDHFFEQLAPIPALMAAADATTRLRIGTHVLDNDFRHPVVLAKEAATLDLLSDGRLELGLGAGWLRSDYEQSGNPYETAGTRIDKLQESVTILKGLFGRGPFSFEGDHYSIEELDGRPKPVQEPRPPLIIGGGGKRILSLAAREADIVGINPNLRSGRIRPEELRLGTRDWSIPGEGRSSSAVAERVEWVRQAAGRRFDDLELAMFVRALVTDDRSAGVEKLSAALEMEPHQVRGAPQFLVGSVAQICEDLEARRSEYGISYWITGQAGFASLAAVVARLAGSGD